MEDYVAKLEPDVRLRYHAKTACIGCDPYSLDKSGFSSDWKTFPDVEYPDIYNYLINRVSSYTHEQLRSYKSLEAYRLFHDGYVRDVEHKTINGLAVVRSKVMHSMRVNEKPVLVWLISNASGEINTAHCTCMAGLGESCSHVGATLFFMETATKYARTQP